MIDAALEEVLALARRVAEQAENVVPGEDAERLAAKVLDLDAQLRAGRALPLAWREPGGVGRVERLLWAARRLGGALRPEEPCDGVSISRIPPAASIPGEGWIAIGAALPAAVYGSTPERAAAFTVAYLVLLLRNRGDGDSEAVAFGLAMLAELGYDLAAVSAQLAANHGALPGIRGVTRAQ